METKVNFRLNNGKLTGEWCKHYRRVLHKIASKKRRVFTKKLKDYERE